MDVGPGALRTAIVDGRLGRQSSLTARQRRASLVISTTQVPDKSSPRIFGLGGRNVRFRPVISAATCSSASYGIGMGNRFVGKVASTCLKLVEESAARS